MLKQAAQKYLPIIAIPNVVFLGLWLTGHEGSFSCELFKYLSLVADSILGFALAAVVAFYGFFVALGLVAGAFLAVFRLSFVLLGGAYAYHEKFVVKNGLKGYLALLLLGFAIFSASALAGTVATVLYLLMILSNSDNVRRQQEKAGASGESHSVTEQKTS